MLYGQAAGLDMLHNIVLWVQQCAYVGHRQGLTAFWVEAPRLRLAIPLQPTRLQVVPAVHVGATQHALLLV